jgi:hypothetical protein
MHIELHVKYRLFVSDFKGNFDFLDRFSKNTQILNFMKIRPLGAELFHSDMTEIIVAFSHFANAPQPAGT